MERDKKFGTIHYDEEIALKIDDYVITYYFTKDRFLARVIRGAPNGCELPELLP